MPLTRSIDVDQGVGAKRRCWVRRILSGRLVPNLRVPRSGPLTYTEAMPNQTLPVTRSVIGIPSPEKSTKVFSPAR